MTELKGEGDNSIIYLEILTLLSQEIGGATRPKFSKDVYYLNNAISISAYLLFISIVRATRMGPSLPRYRVFNILGDNLKLLSCGFLQELHHCALTMG